MLFACNIGIDIDEYMMNITITWFDKINLKGFYKRKVFQVEEGEGGGKWRNAIDHLLNFEILDFKVPDAWGTKLCSTKLLRY